MRAHVLNEQGEIVNTVEVASLDVIPGLVDASIGGQIGDSLVEGVVVPKENNVDLVALKAERNMQIHYWRAAANQTTFPFSGKLISCDQLSRSDIDAVASSIALTGAFPAGFPNAWRATDNTYVLLPTVDSFKALHSAMTAQGTANFAYSQQLKAALAAATTQAEIEAVKW